MLTKLLSTRPVSTRRPDSLLGPGPQRQGLPARGHSPAPAWPTRGDAASSRGVSTPKDVSLHSSRGPEHPVSAQTLPPPHPAALDPAASPATRLLSAAPQGFRAASICSAPVSDSPAAPKHSLESPSRWSLCSSLLGTEPGPQPQPRPRPRQPHSTLPDFPTAFHCAAVCHPPAEGKVLQGGDPCLL